ncbi:hypothetical protein K501DRAFT_174357 [Backusella circina FSU 941]|nr:hypothetical protein K501DRAFT_174357 [Backusella circina FSU 941]
MLSSTSSVPPTVLKDNVTSQIAISIVMYPAIGGFPSAWEFTLIIIVALLAVSFLASVGMHWHLWRIRRRQRTRFENGLLEDPTFNRKVIDPQYLSCFPTRIIGEGGELSRVESNKSVRSNKALENAELLSSNSSNIPIDRLSVEESTTEEGCVICLDEFSAGEKVRGLPCGHEYHCECIGKYI